MTGRWRRFRRRVAAVLLAVAVPAGVLAGCSDDGDDGGGDGGAGPAGTVPGHPSTSEAPATGDLDLEVPDGYYAVPLPSFGVGLAVPLGWEAVVLTDEALDQIEGLDAVASGFVDAARNAQGAGAVLYAAGVDSGGGVADLKLARLPGIDLEAAATAAGSAAPEGAVVARPEDVERPVVQVRFQAEGEGADGEVVAAEGTQWLLEGPDAVWSLVVTSEDDPVGHDRLARALLDGVVFPGED